MITVEQINKALDNCPEEYTGEKWVVLHLEDYMKLKEHLGGDIDSINGYNIYCNEFIQKGTFLVYPRLTQHEFNRTTKTTK